LLTPGATHEAKQLSGARMRGPLALALLLHAGAAAADPVLPSLYHVTGVGATSVLNVRAGPGTGSPVVGTLAPDAKGVEVVAVDPTGRWGQHNLGEGAGWSSLHFLAEEAGVWTPTKLPQSLSCFGTEPFWSIRRHETTVVLETPEGARTLGLAAALDTGIAGDVRRAVELADGITRATVTITPGSCSDGMSDRVFGLEAMVVIAEGGGAPRLLTGCCSVAP
jgi:uncharacterized membrane protein